MTVNLKIENTLNSDVMTDLFLDTSFHQNKQRNFSPTSVQTMSDKENGENISTSVESSIEGLFTL